MTKRCRTVNGLASTFPQRSKYSTPLPGWKGSGAVLGLTVVGMEHSTWEKGGMPRCPRPLSIFATASGHSM